MQIKEIQQFIDDNHLWAKETFPKQTAKGTFLHLKSEVDEVLMELDHQQTFDSEGPALLEVADCFILLMNGAKKMGFSFEQIMTASINKMRMNRKRDYSGEQRFYTQV